MSRKTIIFHGRVQGVGFRFSTYQIAQKFRVQGYVRNLPDGTVELVVEGERIEIQQFLTELTNYFSENISRTTEPAEACEETFTSFEIRH